MDEREWLAERFDEHRTHLRAVAYRMLGSLSEAEDAVQEAWLRLSRSDAGKIENLGGWLTATRDGRPFSVDAVTVRDGKIVELDFLADPERLAQLDLTVLDG
jgi:Sigma-70 region 2